VGARFSAPVQTGPGTTQLPIQWVPGLYWGVMRPGRGVYHPPYLAQMLKKEYSYTFTPPLGLRGMLEGELYLYLYLASGMKSVVSHGHDRTCVHRTEYRRSTLLVQFSVTRT
jgi:hypothetical protein